MVLNISHSSDSTDCETCLVFSEIFLVLALLRYRRSRDADDLEVLHCELVLPTACFTGTQDCHPKHKLNIHVVSNLASISLEPHHSCCYG